ncbi:IS110 family transposase [Rhizobium sp. SIMBA_035]
MIASGALVTLFLIVSSTTYAVKVMIAPNIDIFHLGHSGDVQLAQGRQIHDSSSIDRTGHREERIPGLRSRRIRRTVVQSKDFTVLIARFLQEAPTVPCGYGVLLHQPSLARSIGELGHEVRLIHAAYVKPFVNRDKTDANDAEAIHEAVFRKSMRFVPIKSETHQASVMLFKTRSLLVKQRVRAINALRAHLSELGLVARPGAANVSLLIAAVRDRKNKAVPPAAKTALKIVAKQIEALTVDIEALSGTLKAEAKADDEMKRLMTIPGVGPMTATAIRAFVPDARIFKSARHFASWTGLTPKSFSSGECVRIGGISKMGNAELRSLLVTGAMSVIRNTKVDTANSWVASLKRRRPFKVASIALANKTARIIWALLVKGGSYGSVEASAG